MSYIAQVLFLSLAITLPLALQQQTDPTVRFNRAVELQRAGQLEQAADEYRALLKVAPAYAEAHANLGVVLAQLGQHQQAVESYQSALRLAPKLTQINLNLGIAHYRAGQFESAVEALEKFLATNPDSIQARQLLGISLVEVGGRDAEAVRQLEQALRAAPDDVAVLHSLGVVYLRANRMEVVKDIAERLAALPGGVAVSHLLNGQTLLARFEFERAIAELEAAAKLNPELPRLQYSLGIGYTKLSRNSEAIAAFEKELRLTPKDFTTIFYLAYLHEAGDDLSAARRLLDEALKLEPQSPEANALLGKILMKQGKSAEALQPLESAVLKDPTDPDKRYLLARVYQTLGRRQDATREFAEVQRLKARQLETDRARTPKH